jgi:glycosyltransferase involved in cell wall biosynthesis
MTISIEENLVSICIPTYNRPKLISLLLDSIFSQTYELFEVIITDNSENDETRSLITKKYKDHRVRYYKNSNNLGMNGNSIKALKLVRGEFYCFTPDDDIWIDKRKLEKQVSFLKDNEEINCSFSNAKHIRKNGETHQNQFKSIYSARKPRIISSKDLLIQNKPKHFLCILTAMMRTKELPLFVKSWDFGSEELYLWYIGGTGQRIGYHYEQMVSIRDGDHNWQIITAEEKVLQNLKDNRTLKGLQLINIYKYFKTYHPLEIKKINFLTQIKLLRMLYPLIGKSVYDHKKVFSPVLYYSIIPVLSRIYNPIKALQKWIQR